MYVEFIFPITELCMRKLTKGEAMQDIVGRIIFTGTDQLCSSKMLADNYMQFYYQLAKDAKQRHLTIHNEHIRKFEEGLDSQKKKNVTVLESSYVYPGYRRRSVKVKRIDGMDHSKSCKA